MSGPRVDAARRQLPAPLLAALRRGVDRGARVLSVCTGAFVLGAAGLLDGRRCTTHWRQADELARLFPAAKVDPDVLYVDDDPVITSAGTAAGIDACLYLVRKEQGSKVANAIARRMVVPPHRDGGQAQYVERPVRPARGRHARATSSSWMERHLDQQVTVDDLAPPRGDVGADLRPAVRPGNRHHAAALADRASGSCSPSNCWRRPTRRSRRWRAVRLRQRDRPAPPLPDLAGDHAAGLPPPVPRALLCWRELRAAMSAAFPPRSRSSALLRRASSLVRKTAPRPSARWPTRRLAGWDQRRGENTPCWAAPRRPVPSGSAPGPR